MPYIVFELVQVNIDDYVSQNYVAKAMETVFLAVMPNSFDYRLAARDAITQTDRATFINKLSFTPERCSIRGNFGLMPKLIDGIYMTGWQRLQQFNQNIVRLSKNSSQPNDTQRFIYALNFYDFWWQKYGSINIQSFQLRGDASRNSQLPFYSLDFIIIGDLIQSQNADPLLAWLKTLQNASAAILDPINNLLSGLDPVLSYATLPLGILDSAMSLASDAQQYLGAITSGSNSISSNISSIFPS
jgi:hypothetical protein